MKDTINKTEFEKMLERKVAEEAKKQQEAEVNDSVNPGNVPSSETEASERSDTQMGAELVQQVAALQEECAQQRDQVLRARADFDNYRKRMARDMEQVRQTAAAGLIRELLPVLDNLRRALDHADSDSPFTEGVRMVYKQLEAALVAQGLEPIEALGTVFNPEVHDALAMTHSDSIEQGVVIEVYEQGYRLRETILRPARVIVSAGPEHQPEDNVPSDMNLVEGDDVSIEP